jgi:uncharacterized membrane protein
LSSEECNTTLSKKRVPLKALLLLLIFAFGSLTVSGTVLPFTISDAQKTTGSFVLTISPSPIAVPQGMNATSIVTILSTQGFTGTVTLTAQVTSGIAVVFGPSGVNVPVGGTATSITTVQAAKNASIGTYNLIITGTAAAGRKVLSSSTLLTATVNPPGDFGVYAYPYSITVVAGFTNSTSIILYGKNGFNGSVTLSATVPFGFLGVMGGQNPVKLTPGATNNTSLLVSTTTSTILGRYNVTITGSSGTISHSCILAVNVVDPSPESLTLLGVTNKFPTNLTLSLRNNGNTPMTLQSYSVTDISGDMWTLANWTGPTISPGSTSPAVILIGSSCNTCTYKGVIDLFQQFVATHTYLITITTKLNTQFTFTVVF